MRVAAGARAAGRLEGDNLARDADAAAFQEEAHAESFGALHGDEAHLAADVVRVGEQSDLGFVSIGILLEALDAVEDGLAEARADFDSIRHGAIIRHGANLKGTARIRAKFRWISPQVLER